MSFRVQFIYSLYLFFLISCTDVVESNATDYILDFVSNCFSFLQLVPEGPVVIDYPLYKIKEIPDTIYFERQSYYHCGKHAINNVLQGDYVSIFDLEKYAYELEVKEAELLKIKIGWGNSKVAFQRTPYRYPHQWGNYNVEVLRLAFQNLHYEMKQIDKRDNLLSSLYFLVETSISRKFIINRNKRHWIGVVEIEQQMYKLDSQSKIRTFVDIDAVAHYFHIILRNTESQIYHIIEK